jgi:hypothetical protein
VKYIINIVFLFIHIYIYIAISDLKETDFCNLNFSELAQYLVELREYVCFVLKLVVRIPES